MIDVKTVFAAGACALDVTFSTWGTPFKSGVAP
jgi:hypothetical protein